MNTIKSFILFCMALLFFACGEEQEPENFFDDESRADGSYWEKHDGTGFIYLFGSAAKFCMPSSDNAQTGSYDPSTGEIEINLDGQPAHFEVMTDGNTMILTQHFSGGEATEVAYLKSSAADFPCGIGTTERSAGPGNSAASCRCEPN